MKKTDTETYILIRYSVFAYCLVIVSLLCQSAGATSFNQEPADNIPWFKKNLERRFDAVVIKGERLGAMEGTSIASIRLFSFIQGRFQSIPFQIDERDPEGVYVLTSGPQASEDVDKGHLDYNDDLVFMARDSGDRAPKDIINIPDTDKWVEIALSDPIDLRKKAWVYCCHFPDTPPALSPVDYVDYFPEKEQIFTENYGLGYRKGMSLYTDLFYADGKGGFGPDFIDRIKVRIEVKFLFNLLKITKSEEDFRAEVVGWKDGPVRVLRNVQNYVRVLFNLSSPSVFSITEYYSDYMYTPMRTTVPFDLKWVFNKFGISEWYLYFYGDLPGLNDGMMYTNKNLNGVPLSTSVPKAWYDTNVNMDYLVWGYATKKNVGTWFCNIVMPDALFQYAKFYLNVDEKGKYPPEDIMGEVGGGALIDSKVLDKDLWDMVLPGTYQFGLETFFAPPGFRPQGVQEWRNIREFPVQATLQRSMPKAIRTEDKNESQTIDPELVKKGTSMSLTDIHGKKIILYDVRLHFGSILATGMDFLAGQELKTRKWYNISLNEIRFWNLRIEKEEPITGMKNPLIAKITKKDGTVLDLVACKCCTLSGFRADGKRAGYVFSEIKDLEMIEQDKLMSQ